MKYLILPLLLGSLALTGCNKEESERKASIEKQADAKEKQADAVKDQADAASHQIKAEGERASKELKAEADAKRDEKKNP